jgi:hypothetical protein
VHLEKLQIMKSLDFTAMENIQGGMSGNISINFPLTGLLTALGLGSLLGAALEFGIGISYTLDTPSLPLGL